MNSACKAIPDRPIERGGMPHRHSNDDVPRIADPRLAALLSYWLTLRDGRLTPERQDFDPTMVPSLLSNFWILKREPDTGRYRFQLAGEVISALLRQRVQNRYIDELFPDFGQQFNTILETVTSTPAIFHLLGSAYRNGEHDVQTERLVMPMADRGVVDTVFGATVCDETRLASSGEIRYTGTATQTCIPVAGLCRTAQ